MTYRARRWRELLDQARALLADLEAGGELVERAAVPSRWDGYPSATLGGGGGTDPNPFASKVAERVDFELGHPTDDGAPPRDPDADTVDAAAQAMRAQVVAAIAQLRGALGAMRRGEPRQAAYRPAAAEAPGCVNCERFDVYAVQYKDGRCVACYGYKRRSRERGEGAGLGLDAPERLVKERPENATRRSLAVRVDPKEHHG